MKHIITPEEIGMLARPCTADKSLAERLIAEAEREDIRPRLGDALFLKVTADEPAVGYDTLINGGEWTDRRGMQRYLQGLKTAVAYYAYARVVRDGNIQATRYGAVIKQDENSGESEKSERMRHYREAFSAADGVLAEVMSYLDENRETFPEYRSKTMVNNRTKMRVIGSGACSTPKKGGGHTVIMQAPPHITADQEGNIYFEGQFLTDILPRTAGAAAEAANAAAQKAEAAAALAEKNAGTALAAANEAKRIAEEADAIAKEAARVAGEANATNEQVKQAETARVQAESARVQAEKLRATAETARVEAEKLRVTAETARVEAEKLRVAAEQTRAQAESTRVSAEQKRVQAESARAAAETKRQEDTSTAISAANSATEKANTAAGNAEKVVTDALLKTEQELTPEEKARVATNIGAVGRKANYEMPEISGEVFNDGNSADGFLSHAEGSGTSASGASSHAQNANTQASGDNSTACGLDTIASGESSFSEGNNTKAEGIGAHAMGDSTEAKGDFSLASGQGTIANNACETAHGKFNKSGDGTLYSVGVGTDKENRKNAVEVKDNGDVYMMGVGGYDGTNPESAKPVHQAFSGGGGGSADSVLFTPQQLTDEQKTQAQSNIGVQNTIELFGVGEKTEIGLQIAQDNKFRSYTGRVLDVANHYISNPISIKKGDIIIGTGQLTTNIAIVSEVSGSTWMRMLVQGKKSDAFVPFVYVADKDMDIEVCKRKNYISVYVIPCVFTSAIVSSENPNRELYESFGLSYNYDNDTYSYQGITNITDLEAKKMVATIMSGGNLWGAYSKVKGVRVNLPLLIHDYTDVDMTQICASNFDIEIFNIGESVVVTPTGIAEAFLNAYKLRKIICKWLNFSKITSSYSTVFQNAAKFEGVKIRNLSANFSIKNCPLWKYDYLRDIVNNLSNGPKQITITVHPTTYSYLTGTTEPTPEVGGTKEKWMQLVTDATAKNCSFASA